MRFVRMLVPVAAAVLFVPALARAQDKPRLTTDSVYTEEQATRGKDGWATLCASCHFLEEHSNGDFKATWDTKSLFDLFELLRTTMPQDNPGALSKDQYIDVVAYILKLNGAPSGSVAIPTDTVAMKTIRLVMKAGPPKR